MPNRLEISYTGGDLTDKFWQKRLNVDLGQEGYTAEFTFDFTVGTPPAEDTRFTLTLPNNDTLLFQSKTFAKTNEYYGDPNIPIWIKTYLCVDPLSTLYDNCVPESLPYINSTTGAILASIINTLDPTLDTSGLATGNSVTSFNPKDFTTFGEVIRSEIMAGGYVIRMGLGNLVEGGFEGTLGTFSPSLDYTDYRYTPLQIDISPPDTAIDAATVSGSEPVPLYHVSEWIESDGRVQPVLNLQGKAMDLDKSQVLSLDSGIDISDEDTYYVTGGLSVNGSHIRPNGGKIVVREAYPYKLPFSSYVTGIVALSGSASFQAGFTNQAGSFLLSVSASDFGGLIQDTSDDQHTYHAYFAPTTAGTIKKWLLHIEQNFTVDPDQVIAQITAIDSGAKKLTLNSAWNIGNDFIKVSNGGVETGRAAILKKTDGNTVLYLDAIPVGTTIGDDVSRGVGGDITLTISDGGSTSAGNGYGLPTISGSNVGVQKFQVQRTGQIHGRVIERDITKDGETYPRDLLLDVDVNEFTDAQVAVSGSGATITFGRKFNTDKRIITDFNYIIGAKKDFHSGNCTQGTHAQVTVDNEPDPAILQALADRIVAVGGANYPTVKWPLFNVLADVTPLPHMTMPLNLDPEYGVSATGVPLQSVGFEYKGGDNDDDIILYDLLGGFKRAEERVKEEALRGREVTKFPIRVASLSGATISSATWDDEAGTLTYSISGASEVYDPRGQALGTSATIRPAEVAGTTDPHEAPVIVRLTAVPTRSNSLHNDLCVFTVIYKPEAIDGSSISSRIFSKDKQIEYKWARASGALKYNIYRQLSVSGGDSDSNLELIDTVVSPGNWWRGPVEKDYLALFVESVGLCDKTSAKVKVNHDLPQLPAPSPFTVRKKANASGRAVFLVGAPPSGSVYGNRAVMLRIKAYASSGLISAASGFPNDDNLYVQDYPVTADTTAARYRIRYDEYDPGEVYNVTACWVGQFSDEGIYTTPIDAANPPISVGSINVSDFFQTATQVNGGTVEDDADTTTIVEHTGKYRVHLGTGNDEVKLFIERSARTTNGSVGTFPSAPKTIKESIVTEDVNIINGYVDIDFVQRFQWAKRKQFTYRPTKAYFLGRQTRLTAASGGGTEQVQAIRKLVGYTGSVPSISEWEIDGVFDKSTFEFQPGKSGVSHSYLQVDNVRSRQKKGFFKGKWDMIDDANIRRYIVFLSTTNFGTKGPSGDPNIAVDLDAIMATGGTGNIVLYNQANTTRNVTAYALDVGVTDHYVFYTDETYGSITISPSQTYYFGVLAQNKAGRYSDLISDTDSNSPDDETPETGYDEGVAAWGNANCASQVTDVNTSDGETYINLRLKTLDGGGANIVKFIRPNSTEPVGSPCLPPRFLTKYGALLKAATSNNWFDPSAQGTPIVSSGSAEIIIEDRNAIIEYKYSILADVFKSQGFVVALRPYNLVSPSGAETAGDWTTYTDTVVFPVPGDETDDEPTGPHGSLTGFTSINDIVVTNTHAFILDYLSPAPSATIHAVDIRDKNAPFIVDSYTTVLYNCFNLDYYSNKLYAYGASTAAFVNTGEVIDVSDPTNMTQIGVNNIGNSPSNTYLSILSYPYLYFVHIVGGNTLKIYDVSNPTSWLLKSALNLDVSGPGLPIRMSKEGNYLAISNAARFQMVSVANVSSPSIVSSTVNPTGTHIDSLLYDDKLFLMQRGTGSSDDYIYAYNVSNAASPSLIGSTNITNGAGTAPFSATAKGLIQKGFRLFVPFDGNNNNTLGIYDTTDPGNLTLINYVDLNPSVTDGMEVHCSAIYNKWLYFGCDNTGSTGDRLVIVKKGGRVYGAFEAESLTSETLEVSEGTIDILNVGTVNAGIINTDDAITIEPTIPISSGYVFDAIDVSSNTPKPSIRFYGTSASGGNWQFSNDGISFTNIGSSSATGGSSGTGIIGQGTVNYIPKFSASATLTDSIVRESSGTIITSGNLAVTGTVTATGDFSTIGHATVSGGQSLQNHLVLEPSGSVVGQIRFRELSSNGNNYVGLKSPDNLTTNTVWVLPTADGSAGQIITTDGASQLYFTTAASAPTSAVFNLNVREQDGNPSVYGVTGLIFGNADVTDNGDGTVRIKSASDVTIPSGVTGTGTISTIPKWASVGSLTDSIITEGATRINVSGRIYASGMHSSGDVSVYPVQGVVSELKLYELESNGVNYVGFKSPNAVSANKVWALPNGDGSAGQLLSTDGSGNLYFATAASGSAVFNLVVKEEDDSPLVSGVTQIKVANRDLIDQGSGVIRIRTASDVTGSLRNTATYSTASLGVDGQDSTVSLSMAKSCILISVQTNVPAYIVAYASTALRAADVTLARNEYTRPSPGSGIMFEGKTSSGALSITCSPAPVLANSDAPVTSNIPFRIKNKNTTSGVVSITATYMSMEPSI